MVVLSYVVDEECLEVLLWECLLYYVVSSWVGDMLVVIWSG